MVYHCSHKFSLYRELQTLTAIQGSRTPQPVLSPCLIEILPSFFDQPPDESPFTRGVPWFSTLLYIPILVLQETKFSSNPLLLFLNLGCIYKNTFLSFSNLFLCWQRKMLKYKKITFTYFFSMNILIYDENFFFSRIFR